MPLQIPDDRQIFFLHVPKTAGSTLREILRSAFDKDEICPAKYMNEFNELPDNYNEIYRLIMGHFSYNLTKKLKPNPITITVLRDPVQRAISTYYQVKRAKPIPNFYNPIQQENLSINEYAFDERVYNRTSNVAVKLLGNGDLELAKERLSNFSVVGTTEHFQEALNLLCYTLGWKPIMNYESRNKTASTERVKAIDSKTIEQFTKLNVEDIELYEFAQDEFNKRYQNMLHHLLAQNSDLIVSGQDVPAATSIDVDFSTYEFFGSGWYPPQSNPRFGNFRWMGASNKATILFTLNTNFDYELSFTVTDVVEASMLRDLKVEFNGNALDLQSVVDKRTHRFSAHIHSSFVCRDINCLCFITPTPKPKDDQTDGRQLSISLNQILLKPAVS